MKSIFEGLSQSGRYPHNSTFVLNWQVHSCQPILDFGFWIDPDHKGTLLKDFGFGILDLLGTQGAGFVPKQSKI